MMRQTVALQPVAVNGGADTHLQAMEHSTPEQVEAVSAQEACTEAGSWQDRWTREEGSSMLEAC